MIHLSLSLYCNIPQRVPSRTDVSVYVPVRLAVHQKRAGMVVPYTVVPVPGFIPGTCGSIHKNTSCTPVRTCCYFFYLFFIIFIFNSSSSSARKQQNNKPTKNWTKKLIKFQLSEILKKRQKFGFNSIRHSFLRFNPVWTGCWVVGVSPLCSFENNEPEAFGPDPKLATAGYKLWGYLGFLSRTSCRESSKKTQQA